LAEDVRERIMKLYQDGTVRPSDFDRASLDDLKVLRHDLQMKSLEHCEHDRVFLANARSKSGFLVSVCSRAKRGELDPRGFGAQDPWKVILEAMVNDKKRDSTLTEDKDWIDQHPNPITLKIDVSYTGHAQNMIDITLKPQDTMLQLKEQLSIKGISWPVSKMKIRLKEAGYLRNERSVAYYNLTNNETLELVLKTRGSGFVQRTCRWKAEKKENENANPQMNGAAMTAMMMNQMQNGGD